MTGKRYYLTTLAAWQRRDPHIANSHFVILRDDSGGARHAVPDAIAGHTASDSPADNAFDAVEILAHLHPLLRHRVF
jgi:hypothetical protein